MRSLHLFVGAASIMCLAALWSDISSTRAQDAKGTPAPAQKVQPAKATPAEALHVRKDFKVELLHSVSPKEEGSWVSMCVDPEGRLLVCDQGSKGLFRITPSPLNGNPDETRIEHMPAKISSAQGLLWAFGSLYINVNISKPGSAFFRVKASQPGGVLDEVTQLRAINGAGEHGPHAILLAPDGKSLYIVAGNDTKLMDPLAGSLVPKNWGEDRLDGLVAQFNGVTRPAGCIYQVDPDGKNWTLVSCGMRNTYDIAFNRYGDLFGYDSDMEFDMNAPWYRPTRVFLASSGSDMGFRNGSANAPPRYPDTLPALVNVGPGSPTGITFGYGAKFPAKYQEGLFMNDWSYGRMFITHLTPEGSAYKAELEEFITGAPLPLTDIVVNPKDGALYFLIGGRGTQSGLYRVTYVGKESTAPSKGDDTGAKDRALRHSLEAFHGHADPKAVATAWPILSSPDRFLRYAARVAIEHQDVKEWQNKALKETNPIAATHALLALVRSVGEDPLTHPRKKDDPIPNVEMRGPILEALARVDLTKLNDSQRSDLVRVYSLLVNRLGTPEGEARDKLLQRLDGMYPAKTYELNADLCLLLVYLQSPTVAAKTMPLIANAPSQEEQIDYAKSLRNLKVGWTPNLRKQYFEWFGKAASYRGGAQLAGAIGTIRTDAAATLTDEERVAVAPLLNIPLKGGKGAPPPVVAKSRPVVKQWTMDELLPIVEKGLTNRDFDRGHNLFGEARCFNCHRFGLEGGIQGPDLTMAGARFNAHDVLESILEPSKVISDQYASQVFTLNDGRVFTGRIINYQSTSMSILTNLEAPGSAISINPTSVESIMASPVSMMPSGLLDGFHEDEILDLVAFTMSRGDRTNKMFKK